MPVRAFSFYPLRFSFRAIDRIYFPAGKSANILRGAFGLMFKRIADPERYARIFEPTAITSTGAVPSPSGLANHPRPFSFPASLLSFRHIAPTEEFHFRPHLFTLDPT